MRVDKNGWGDEVWGNRRIFLAIKKQCNCFFQELKNPFCLRKAETEEPEPTSIGPWIHWQLIGFLPFFFFFARTNVKKMKKLKRKFKKREKVQLFKVLLFEFLSFRKLKKGNLKKILGVWVEVKKVRNMGSVCFCSKGFQCIGYSNMKRE